MDKYIRVKNCNCISDATIEIVEKSLNIKYGSNGTGKSTISEAIYAQANNETDRLKDFKPYAVDVLESYIGDNTKADELYAELQMLAKETDYLYKKIEKICMFKPMNVTHVLCCRGPSSHDGRVSDDVSVFLWGINLV